MIDLYTRLAFAFYDREILGRLLHVWHSVFSKEIKRTILQWTGLPVYGGIGSTKTLAKMANHCAKKHPQYAGICNFNTLTPQAIDQILGLLPVKEVWGIGSRLAFKLNGIGITTALDLKQAHSRTLRYQFSVVMAKIIAELNGISCWPGASGPA